MQKLQPSEFTVTNKHRVIHWNQGRSTMRFDGVMDMRYLQLGSWRIHTSGGPGGARPGVVRHRAWFNLTTEFSKILGI